MERLLIALSALLISACATIQPEPAPADRPLAMAAPEAMPEADRPFTHCPFGDPVMGASWSGQQLTWIQRGGYTLMHHDDFKVPAWICEEMTVADVHGPLTGRDSWRTDPELCDLQVRCDRGSVNSDYTHSGYDRGHLAPNLNQRLDAGRKAETFFFSNAAPQVGRRFNQSTWQALELDLTVHVCAVDRLWTITGLLFHDPANPDQWSALGEIGAGVHIPTHYYKVVISEDDAGGFAAYAVVMENREYADGEEFRQFVKPVAWLEDVLDVTFFPDLTGPGGEGLRQAVSDPLPYRFRGDCRAVCGDGGRCQ